MREPLTFLLAVGACARLTRLLVNDDWPFGSLRSLLKIHAKDSWLQAMTSCPWCVSGWLSLAVTTALWLRGGLPVPFLAWLGLWWATCAAYWLTEALAAAGATDDPPETLEPWGDD